VSKADVIKHMLSMPILNGRVGKWILALSEFDLRFESVSHPGLRTKPDIHYM
jgi:hypothetical protein